MSYVGYVLRRQVVLGFLLRTFEKTNKKLS